MTVLRDELQRTLGASYTIERELGGGGMSSVFVARDNALGRSVVVKVLPYELAATVSVDRFTREIAPLILNGPPSVTGFAGGRPKPEEIVAYWPALIDKAMVQPAVELVQA